MEPLFEPSTPCYVLFRFDTKTPTGHEWLLLSWTPDSATIRQKMLYASTKATLKNEFGTSHIKEEMHATSKVCYVQLFYRSLKDKKVEHFAAVSTRHNSISKIII